MVDPSAVTAIAATAIAATATAATAPPSVQASASRAMPSPLAESAPGLEGFAMRLVRGEVPVADYVDASAGIVYVEFVDGQEGPDQRSGRLVCDQREVERLVRGAGEQLEYFVDASPRCVDTNKPHCAFGGYEMSPTHYLRFAKGPSGYRLQGIDVVSDAGRIPSRVDEVWTWVGREKERQARKRCE